MPQTNDNNSGPWEKLESYCRKLVLEEGKELYILSGPLGKGGQNKEGITYEYLLKKHIRVPAATWKVVLIKDDKNEDDIQAITPNHQMIAVIIPNKLGIKKDTWKRYVTTVDDIETQTGYDFFELIDNTIEQTIESKKYQWWTSYKLM